MPRVVLVLVLAALLAVPPRPAQAQAEAVPAQVDMVTFATEYTGTVMVGIVGGGVLMNVLIGGGPATLAGALLGSTVASWLFIERQARHYVIRRAGTGPAH